MIKNVIVLAALAVCALAADARNILSDNNYYARVGYALGGTAPLDFSPAVRSINGYWPRPNSFSLGVDGYHPFNRKWGLMVGLRFGTSAMKADAKVKGYRMKLQMDGVDLEGMYTGDVQVEASQTYFSLPVQATLNLGQRWRLKLGPYISYITSHTFKGYVHDGYLREYAMDDRKHYVPELGPTGSKVEMGHTSDSGGNYDFSENMRNWQYGVALGADWYASNRWGGFVGVNWGCNGIFDGDFNVIDQTLFPLYAEIGVLFRMK